MKNRVCLRVFDFRLPNSKQTTGCLLQQKGGSPPPLPNFKPTLNQLLTNFFQKLDGLLWTINIVMPQAFFLPKCSNSSPLGRVTPSLLPALQDTGTLKASPPKSCKTKL